MKSEQRFPVRGLTGTGQLRIVLESKHLMKGICPFCRPTPMSILLLEKQAGGSPGGGRCCKELLPMTKVTV